jgi:hypothetical protein
MTDAARVAFMVFGGALAVAGIVLLARRRRIPALLIFVVGVGVFVFPFLRAREPSAVVAPSPSPSPSRPGLYYRAAATKGATLTEALLLHVPGPDTDTPTMYIGLCLDRDVAAGQQLSGFDVAVCQR